MANFKKISVAAAVAAVLGASSAVQAARPPFTDNEIRLAAPDDVMLVPRVLCENPTSSDRINTLVGLMTVFANRENLTTFGDWRAERHTSRSNAGGFNGKVHWRFYNAQSAHQLDGIIDVTDNDFVRFDWCEILVKSGKTTLAGVDGYLLFHADSLRFNTERNIWLGEGTTPANRTTYNQCGSRTGNAACTAADWETIVQGSATFDTSVLVRAGQRPNGTPTFAYDSRIWLYGHSYMIQGNWASQAFIPILTLPVWDAVVRNGYPAVGRLERGIDYTNTDFASNPDYYRNIVMRYFLDPALSSANEMVFWFNTNSSRRSAVPMETFDSEQVYQYSDTTSLPSELNILRSTPADPALPGMLHIDTERDDTEVVNTGLAHFYIGEVNSSVSWASSGVAFNMLALGAGANVDQVQTEMATAGAELVGPF